MNAKIKVSGNIISELSEKIPSNIVALDELIKNAYDAGAKKVNIKIDSKNKKLSIIDDGSGMNKKDIDTLFHISNSNKIYGKINEYKRRMQGSKGLGFLSVFKFGKYVVWKTKKDIGYEFSLNYDLLIDSSDISNYLIDLKEDSTISKGTQIDISLSEYNIKSLLEYFSEEKYSQKVINSFDDKNFVIILQIDDKVISNENALSIKEYLPERQLYNVSYNSKEQKISFYYNGYLIKESEFKFDSKLYTLDLELIIFQLHAYEKSKINKLFYNPQDELTPLIYINDNLFNNYDLFNPDILKYMKSGLVLNQMIGYIKIISENSMMNFNSDRTHFVQNELTDDITNFLYKINKEIQTVGSKYKKHLTKMNFLTIETLPVSYKDCTTAQLADVIKDNFKFKDKVKIAKEGNKVKYSVFGKQRIITIEQEVQKSQKKYKTAVIELSQKNQNVEIPSKQIDLSKNINRAEDSSGNKISIDDIQIKINDVECKEKILQSITETCTKTIQYSYNDPLTGVIVAKSTLTFLQPIKKVNTGDKEEPLITIPTKERYTINFNIYINKIVDEINKLDLKQYAEVISCSLRSLFEISISSILNSAKYKGFFKNIGLEDRVSETITFISKSKKNKTAISIKSGIDFNSLSNLLVPGDFENAIKKANVGAHKSKTYLSDEDIKNLSKKAAIFIVVVNEMLNNSEITYF